VSSPSPTSKSVTTFSAATRPSITASGMPCTSMVGGRLGWAGRLRVSVRHRAELDVGNRSGEHGWPCLPNPRPRVPGPTRRTGNRLVRFEEGRVPAGMRNMGRFANFAYAPYWRPPTPRGSSMAGCPPILMTRRPLPGGLNGLGALLRNAACASRLQKAKAACNDSREHRVRRCLVFWY
jgi:hypothetical protein